MFITTRIWPIGHADENVSHYLLGTGAVGRLRKILSEGLSRELAEQLIKENWRERCLTFDKALRPFKVMQTFALE